MAVHVQQVAPDRQKATACKNTKKTPLRLATWNVRTLYQCGKLNNVKLEMERLNINVLGICEIRWKESGEFESDGFRMIYSGGDRHERGVGVMLDKEKSRSVMGWWALSDRVLLVKLKGSPFDLSIIQVYAPTSDSSEEEIHKFYDTLEEAKRQCGSQDIIIIMGDLNAKVGSELCEDIVGKHGLGTQNVRGERWVQWCVANGQVITNTLFEEHPRRRWTWKSPDGETKNQIDFITINRRFRNAVQHSKAFPSADCGSDHLPVICKLKVKLRKLKSPKTAQKLQYFELYKNQKIKEAYAVAVQNRFEELEDEEVMDKWNILKEAMVTAAAEVLPKKERQRKAKWMTDEIVDLMRKRQQVQQRGNTEYKTLDKNIKDKCREAKESWLNDKCAEIEQDQRTEPAGMHRKIKDITGHRSCSSTGCIKSKEGTVLVEKDKILERWNEYIGELFHDNRGEKPTINKPMEGLKILKAEVRTAISRMKKNKAAGPDNIVIEMINALEEFGIEKLTEIINEIYEKGEIPTDLSRSIFIALPKRPRAIECELHRTISLMSHITKIILRIIMLRARRIIKPEIGEEQCGFVEDSSTRNAIFMVRMISERAIEMQKNLYLCFIDYTKAFDKVQHEELFKLLQALDLDGKDIQLIRNLYWEQTACIKIGYELSDYTKIERGVRQGCVFSPDLFNLYSEMIMRELDGQKGFVVGGHNINNLRYADDTVLMAESENDLQRLLDIVVEQSKKKGLYINCKKTECMVVCKRERPRCRLKIGEFEIKQVGKYNYLGSIITEDGTCDTEIRRRIGIAKEAFQKLSDILCDRKLSMETKKRVLECYVKTTVVYGG